METRIFVNGHYTTIDPTSPINSTRHLTSFCCYNGIRNALLRSQGGWYWLHKNGMLEKVARCLYLISFEEIYNLGISEK